jgi:hypothetical protein
MIRSGVQERFSEGTCQLVLRWLVPLARYKPSGLPSAAKSRRRVERSATAGHDTQPVATVAASGEQRVRNWSVDKPEQIFVSDHARYRLLNFLVPLRRAFERDDRINELVANQFFRNTNE